MLRPAVLLVSRLILLLYPPGFRRRRGEEVITAVRATLTDGARSPRPEHLQRGERGLVWPLMLVDLAAGAAAEWGRRLGAPGAAPAPAWRGFDRFLMHLRIALRGLRRSPGFTLVATLTIAAGVAVSSAVFGLVDGVLARPMPYDDPAELVFVWNRFGAWGVPRGWVSGPQITHLSAATTRFEGFATLNERRAELAGNAGTPGALVSVGEVSGRLFSLLGVDAARGRALRPEEEGPDSPHVAVLGDQLWRTRFGADAGVVGGEIRLDGVPYTVVGVMPASFRFAIHAMNGDPMYPQLWVPLPVDLSGAPPGNNSYTLLGRLADGVSIQQAQEELAAVTADYARDRSAYVGDDFGAFLVPLHGDLIAAARPPLLLIGAAVALIMLLVCANLATLYMGRGIDAEQQTALRAALGAGTWARAEVRLLEALLVTFAGGVLGVAQAGWVVAGLLALAPAGLPRAQSVVIDGRVVFFACGLTLAVGIAVALVPWLRERRVDLSMSLRSGARSLAGGSCRAQSMLVVLQVVLAAVLLFSASLIGRSLEALWRVDPGFRADGVLLATVRAPGYLFKDDGEAMLALQQLRLRLLTEASVRDVGYADFLPLSVGGDQNGFSFAGAPGSSGRSEDDDVAADHISAGAGYFDAVGIEIIEGRAFTTADRADSERVVIVDEALARRFWPQGGAVGGTVRYFNEDRNARIVGVARHARRYDLRTDGRVQVYSPLAQRVVRTLELAVHVDGEPRALAAGLRSAAAQVDARLAVDNVRTMSDRVADVLSPWRFMFQLLAMFAATAMFLASLGVYGVVAVSVARRTREIGLRVALGARRGEVGRAVVGEALRLVAAGLALSAVAAIAAGRLLSGFLYGVAPFDVRSFAGAAGLLVLVALIAASRPALRATRVSPMETLRAD